MARESSPARFGRPPSDAPVASGGGAEQVSRIVFDLPCEPRSAAAARSRVTRALGTWRLDHLRDDAALLVSEAVASAVREAHGPEVHVQLSREPNWLRFVVHSRAVGQGRDQGAQADRVVRLPEPDEEGRGLFLVEALAARWGVEALPTGRLVWFDLPIAALS